MATTFTIPLTTLQAGVLPLGPARPADSETQFTLTIDRTVAGGLNSLTAATTIYTQVFQSGDGGATWQGIVETTMQGGPVTDVKTGLAATSSGLSSWLIPGTARQLRVTVTVAGTPVAVAGTLSST